MHRPAAAAPAPGPRPAPGLRPRAAGQVASTVHQLGEHPLGIQLPARTRRTVAGLLRFTDHNEVGTATGFRVLLASGGTAGSTHRPSLAPPARGPVRGPPRTRSRPLTGDPVTAVTSYARKRRPGCPCQEV